MFSDLFNSWIDLVMGSHKNPFGSCQIAVNLEDGEGSLMSKVGQKINIERQVLLEPSRVWPDCVSRNAAWGGSHPELWCPGLTDSVSEGSAFATRDIDPFLSRNFQGFFCGQLWPPKMFHVSRTFHCRKVHSEALCFVTHAWQPLSFDSTQTNIGPNCDCQFSPLLSLSPDAWKSEQTFLPMQPSLNKARSTTEQWNSIQRVPAQLLAGNQLVHLFFDRNGLKWPSLQSEIKKPSEDDACLPLLGDFVLVLRGNVWTSQHSDCCQHNDNNGNDLGWVFDNLSDT